MQKPIVLILLMCIAHQTFAAWHIVLPRLIQGGAYVLQRSGWWLVEGAGANTVVTQTTGGAVGRWAATNIMQAGIAGNTALTVGKEIGRLVIQDAATGANQAGQVGGNSISAIGDLPTKHDSARANPDPSKWQNSGTAIGGFTHLDPVPRLSVPQVDITGQAAITSGEYYPGDKIFIQTYGKNAQYNFLSNKGDDYILYKDVKSYSKPDSTEIYEWPDHDNEGRSRSYTFEEEVGCAAYYTDREGKITTNCQTPIYHQYAVYSAYRSQKLSPCPTGYVSNNGLCRLPESALPRIQKPAETVPCEPRHIDGLWQLDAKNPECAKLSPAFQGQEQEFKFAYPNFEHGLKLLSNGDMQVWQDNGEDRKIVTLSAVNPTTGNRVIKAIETQPTQFSTSSKSDKGNSSIETCGLPGKPPCQIDDNGFKDKDNFSTQRLQETTQALDGIKNTINDLKNQSDHDINTGWLPSLLPGESVQCKPIPVNVALSHGWLSGLKASSSVDICDKLSLLRQIMAYLFGISTVIYIFRVFTRANAGGATQ